MRYGVLGTGSVGRSLGRRLLELGHEVRMGSRTAGNEKAVEWASTGGGSASEGTFADAAAFGEVIVNATPGSVSIEALEAAGVENLHGKVIVDVSNPLKRIDGTMQLDVSPTDSTGEQLQRAFPTARIVKSLNTMNAGLMVNPRKLPESHNVFVNGNDADAKATVRAMLLEFGWRDDEIIDIGDITASRGAEACVRLWLDLMKTFGTANFNLKLVRTQREATPSVP